MAFYKVTKKLGFSDAIPVFENGEFKGYIELSLVLPEVMPHFVRK